MPSQRFILFPSGIPEQKEALADYRRRGGYDALSKVLAARKPAARTEQGHAR